jgi:hypothetical protein
MRQSRFSEEKVIAILAGRAWIVSGGGVQGTLEALPHNQVHNSIGGWMPTPASPRDPIFFMHHCNIDRIWAVWNLHHLNYATYTLLPKTNWIWFRSATRIART